MGDSSVTPALLFYLIIERFVRSPMIPVPKKNETVDYIQTLWELVIP
ncbi:MULTISPECIES: hypothetical protein [unclassified Microcoleus]